MWWSTMPKSVRRWSTWRCEHWRFLLKGQLGYESDDDAFDDEDDDDGEGYGGGSSFGGGSCGFTASECEQLQEQFVKPWDTDARAVLNARPPLLMYTDSQLPLTSLVCFSPPATRHPGPVGSTMAMAIGSEFIQISIKHRCKARG